MLVQHVLFAVLLVVCLARAVTTGADPLALALSTALLLGWYLVGARHAAARLDDVPVHPEQRLTRGGWWFLGLIGCWLVTVAVSPGMIWIAFTLWLLAGHLLPVHFGVPVSVLILLIVVGRSWHAEGWTVAAMIGPTIGGAFAFALARGLQLLVRDNLERRRLVVSLVAAQEEAETLHAELIETQRRAGVVSERTRLSRDIHDTLAQGFSSILLLARAGSATDDETARTRVLEQIQTSAAENLDEARRVVGALAPAPLESGLVEALRSITARFTDETGLPAELRVDGDVTALSPALEVALLRTAQSALANVRQHAAAHRVVLTLADAEDSVRLDIVDDGCGFDLTVHDDGCGFDPAGLLARWSREQAGRGGYGLRAARARLRELGGGLEVESEPGVGTAIGAHVPRAFVSVREAEDG